MVQGTISLIFLRGNSRKFAWSACRKISAAQGATAALPRRAVKSSQRSTMTFVSTRPSSCRRFTLLFRTRLRQVALCSKCWKAIRGEFTCGIGAIREVTGIFQTLNLRPASFRKGLPHFDGRISRRWAVITSPFGLAEGWDLVLRMIDAGMKIAYHPEVRVRNAM